MGDDWNKGFRQAETPFENPNATGMERLGQEAAGMGKPPAHSAAHDNSISPGAFWLAVNLLATVAILVLIASGSSLGRPLLHPWASWFAALPPAVAIAHVANRRLGRRGRWPDAARWGGFVGYLLVAGAGWIAFYLPIRDMAYGVAVDMVSGGVLWPMGRQAVAALSAAALLGLAYRLPGRGRYWTPFAIILSVVVAVQCVLIYAAIFGATGGEGTITGF